MGVGAFKKLSEETMHVQNRHVSEDSTFDLTSFQTVFPKFEFPNLGCGLSASAGYTLVFTVNET